MDESKNERDARMVISRLNFLLLPLLLSADQSFEEFKKIQDQGFKEEKVKFVDFKKAEDEAFKEQLHREQKEILSYKQKVKAFWKEADLGSAKRLVTYSKDLKTQSIIDFQNNEITISQISSDEEAAKEELLKTLDATLRLDNSQAFKNSELEQNIDKINQKSKYIKHSSLDKQKLLETPFDKTAIDARSITLSKKDNLYQLKYELPKDATYKRSFNYLVHAKSNAQRFRLKAQWLLAIMHTESSFNPMARSAIPAYGLMQIVPKSAGIDSYYFLYKQRRLLSASYLYNTQNNIETGSAYFHILYYKYLSSIKDPTSRLYCAIAGYNTGAGNVARAFVGTNSVQKASEVINQMPAEKVYSHLLEHLRYDEPKQYLIKVRSRTQKYQDLYKL